jgi:hypothetical protein
VKARRSLPAVVGGLALLAPLLPTLSPAASAAGPSRAVGPRTQSAPDTYLDPATLGIKPNGAFLDLAAYRGASTWLGLPIPWTVQMLGKRDGVREMTGSSFGQLVRSDAVLRQLAGELRVVMAVPLAFGHANAHTPAGVEQVRRNLQETASGAWDDAYRQVARQLVDAGHADAHLRLGWEFDGAWYPWSAQGGNHDVYKEAFRHVAAVFESVNPDFVIEWNAAREDFPTIGPLAYPGDDVVDVMSMDVYYSSTPRRLAGWREDDWQRNFQRILEFHRDFAMQRGKALGYPEWAVRSIDEPMFIRRFRDWLASLPENGPGRLVYHSYFNTDNHTGKFHLRNHPLSAAAFREVFGAQAGGGPTTTTRPPTTVPTTVAPTTTAPTTVAPTTTAPATTAPATTAPATTTGPTTVPTTVAPTTTTAPTTVAPSTTVGAPLPTTIPADPVVVSVGSPSAVPEGRRSLPFRVRLSQPSAVPVSVTLRTAGGSAQVGRDFQTRQAVVTVPAGETSAWFGVPVIDNRSRDGHRSVVVEVIATEGAEIGRRSATGVILDND